MKTVYIGDNEHFDVIYDVVTHVRKIEDACGAELSPTSALFTTDGTHLLSDALFNFKNSVEARKLSAKQISNAFVNEIKHHLDDITTQNSANDNVAKQYASDLKSYLEELKHIQQQLVDIYEWTDCRDALLKRVEIIDIKEYPNVAMFTSFISSMEHANSCQAEKIQKLLEIIVKSYLSLKNCKRTKNENKIFQALEAFLKEDMKVDVGQVKPDNSALQLRLHDAKQTEAFARAYGEPAVING